MSPREAIAQAHPNIALIKYWGKRDLALNLPATPSLSLTLEPFHTRTRVRWGVGQDRVILNGTPASPTQSDRVCAFLDLIDPQRPPCEVTSINNFPTGAGLASSASAFAALALAATRARGDILDTSALSVLARQGSGSACRSLWGGFVHWQMGARTDGLDSFASPVASDPTWDLVMVTAILSEAAKPVGSTEGMQASERTSPWYAHWVHENPCAIEPAIEAIQARDLPALGRLMERSTLQMHAVMMLSEPPLLYWQPATVAALHAVWKLRAQGLGAWVTMDAGPQVKVLCERKDAHTVREALTPHAQRVHILGPGPGAHLVDAL